jgi:drug/metabolite transporter (DMT)-like permease
LSSLAALGSALLIGSADFLGGWMSRRASPLVVTLWINVVALCTLALVCLVVQPQLSTAHAIGALAGGVVSAFAINLIYASFAAGAMSLTAPLIACGTAIVPTATATVAGNPPDLVQSAGIAFALLGVVAITWTPPAASERLALSSRALGLTVVASLVGGASFSILLLSAKGGASSAVGVSGLSRLTALGTCAVLVFASRGPARVPRSLISPLVGAGELEAAGATLFLVASALGNTAVVAVIVSLYAIVTVLLAQTVLRERIASHQGWGIAAAAIGVALLSAG